MNHEVLEGRNPGLPIFVFLMAVAVVALTGHSSVRVLGAPTGRLLLPNT